MPNTTTSPTLLVCEGKACAGKAARAFDRLMTTAESIGVRTELIRCQGACSGPTAVVHGTDGPRWFEDLKGPKVQRDLCDLARGTDVALPKRLARRELTGKARKRAGKRLAKQR